MMQDLDTNGDGRITFEEFAVWWLSGRQGRTSALSKMFSATVKDNGARLGGGTWKKELLNLAG
jgi:hypothetical protein